MPIHPAQFKSAVQNPPYFHSTSPSVKQHTGNLAPPHTAARVRDGSAITTHVPTTRPSEYAVMATQAGIPIAVASRKRRLTAAWCDVWVHHCTTAHVHSSTLSPVSSSAYIGMAPGQHTTAPRTRPQHSARCQAPQKPNTGFLPQQPLHFILKGPNTSMPTPDYRPKMDK
jgi:hypothetical protein